MLVLLISIITFETVFGWFLDFLDKKEAKKQLPIEITDIYTDQERQLSHNYHEDHEKVGFISDSLSYFGILFLLLLGYLGKFYEYLGLYFQHSIGQALAFFGVIFIVSDLLSLPFAYYSTFVIEEKYGFNKTNLQTFILDKLKSYLLTALIGGTVLFILLYLVENLGQNFWIYFWVVAVGIMLFFNAFYATLILPIFNKLSPLPDSELKNNIVALSKKLDFPLSEIFLLDGSTRSTKANAFFSGIGKTKKIVLYDTLLEKNTNDEILAILAHEVGHYKKNHIYKTFFLAIFEMGLLLYLTSWLIFNPELSLVLGANSWHIPLNLWAIGVLFSPLSTILGIFFFFFSRKHEFEADHFAKQAVGNSEHLVSALKKLTSLHLVNPTPHPLTVFLSYSHPTLAERIRALQKNY